MRTQTVNGVEKTNGKCRKPDIVFLMHVELRINMFPVLTHGCRRNMQGIGNRLLVVSLAHKRQGL